MAYPVQRNLDGVYHRFQRDGKWYDVCFSDLTQEECEACLAKYDREQMSRLVSILADALRYIGDEMNIMAE